MLQAAGEINQEADRSTVFFCVVQHLGLDQIRSSLNKDRLYKVGFK